MKPGDIFFGVLLALLVFYLMLNVSGNINNDSGLGRVDAAGSTSLPAQGAAAASDHPAAVPSLGSAEARLSGQVVQAPAGALEDPGAPSEARDAGSSPALATLLDQFEFSTPMPEDIAWLTIDSWSQPEFLELTQEEAHDLLALDDTMGLKGPATMLSIAGPLPTLDDCRIGFRSQRVQAALQTALMWNAVVIEIGIGELELGSTQGVRAAKELALRQQIAAEEALMVELERATTCPSWRLYWRLYREWRK